MSAADSTVWANSPAYLYTTRPSGFLISVLSEAGRTIYVDLASLILIMDEKDLPISLAVTYHAKEEHGWTDAGDPMAEKSHR